MAAPVYPAQTPGTVSATAAATSVVVPAPSGFANGDLIVIVIGGSSGVTCAPPDGTWTEHIDNAGSTVDLHIYSKYFATASGTSWTFTIGSTKFAGAAIRITGADPTSPVVAVGTVATGGNTPSVATAITPGVVDTLLIQATVVDAIHTFTPDGAMTERVDLQGGTGGSVATRCTIEVATQTLTSSGSTGTRSAAADSDDDWISVLLAVQPPTSTVTSDPLKPAGRRPLFRPLYAR